MELSDSGKVQKRYICGNDLVYADREEGTEKQYYVKNPHGDVLHSRRMPSISEPGNCHQLWADF
ncbi:MAG: hypothetical protein ACLSG9_05945 [Eubacterium sp.]